MIKQNKIQFILRPRQTGAHLCHSKGNMLVPITDQSKEGHMHCAPSLGSVRCRAHTLISHSELLSSPGSPRTEYLLPSSCSVLYNMSLLFPTTLSVGNYSLFVGKENYFWDFCSIPSNYILSHAVMWCLAQGKPGPGRQAPWAAALQLPRAFRLRDRPLLADFNQVSLA